MTSWSGKLARPIAVKGFRKKLVTLRDAAGFVQAEFASVRRSALLEHALTGLIDAAESGDPDDRKRATDRVLALLRDRGLAEGEAVATSGDVPTRIAAMMAGRGSRRR